VDGHAGIGVVMTSTNPGGPPGIPLLRTKLFLPRARRDLVVRPRLLARLAQADGCRCMLLSAPAGAGKTTLLAAWLAAREDPAAWLSLDERDQDVHRFVRYLVAAFQSVAPSCGATALAWLDVPEVDVEALLTSLVNDVAGLPQGTLLVLDDYHLVRSTAVHEALGFLLDHLPPSTSLVLSTREDPPLPVTRLRGRGELRELRAADFSFTVDEASELLVEGMGLPLSPAHVAALVTRTEGWAAGLQLAGLAMRSHTDVSAFVTAFTGSHRLVADYLTAEVLDRQPAPLRRFLLTTSVLDRMCAPLCDAVLAETGAQRVLDELERANLFVVPLDDERASGSATTTFSGRSSASASLLTTPGRPPGCTGGPRSGSGAPDCARKPSTTRWPRAMSTTPRPGSRPSCR
jgi:LuxR family maltose regulon positive regulatory protein